MLRRARRARQQWSLLVVLTLALLLALPGPARAAETQEARQAIAGEVPSLFYDSILYAEIGPKLEEIEAKSDRVRVETIGRSAGGRDLYLVTLSAPEALSRLSDYRALRSAMLKDPAKAQELIDQLGDLKVPVLVNGSIHGDEYPGVDAIMRLIERLAFDDSEETQQILANEILLFNVVQNPDGRVLGRRENAAGFDLNRDWITQSQPEVQATVRVLTEWNPMVVLDLHGFVSPMLIEPCTPPHAPSDGYDVYARWALEQAKAMEAELLAQTGFEGQTRSRSFPEGWDDWPPLSAAMYAVYHGAYGYTLETGHEDARGVTEHYAAVWGALEFTARNRAAMVRDQIDLFRRGFLDLPQVAVPDDALAGPPYDQARATLEFPAAYVIPPQAPLQESPHQAARLIDFLLRNDVQVDKSAEPVTLGDITYPAGSYVVWMNQPKRGLANAILWAGRGSSSDPSLTTNDVSGWSLPLLWGVSQAVVRGPLTLSTQPISRADPVLGHVEQGPASAYAYLPTSNEAIRATNDLLGRGLPVYRAREPWRDGEQGVAAGTLIVAVAGSEGRAIADELAGHYGLTVYPLAAMPSAAAALRRPRLLVSADESMNWVLRILGFEVMPISARQINGGFDPSGYDVLVVSGGGDFWKALDRGGRQALAAFFAAGHGLVGIGPSGARLNEGAGLLDVGFRTGDYYDSGILRLQADPADPITAAYPASTYGFAYYPLWFTSTGSGVVTSATIAEGAFFVSGYWADWQESGAAGKPIVVHGKAGATPVTLIGFDPTFRAHPALTFRILANAIYSALE